MVEKKKYDKSINYRGESSIMKENRISSQPTYQHNQLGNRPTT